MTENIKAELEKPFAPHVVRYKPGRFVGPNKAQVQYYIDVRAVTKRLDNVLGPENWGFEFSLLQNDDSVVVVKGRLTIHIGDKVTVREDVGEARQESEPYKAAVSDALKRCAVQIGIGRYLYRLPTLTWEYRDGAWVDVVGLQKRVMEICAGGGGG